jgi:hypothetical protein
MAKIGYLYLRNGVWEGKQLLPPAWIDMVSHATVDMTLDPHASGDPELRYSNLFWAFPKKHVYMAVGYHRQLIMVFPDLGIVAVTTGRGNYSRSELVDYIAGSVKSDTSLPADVAGALLLANKILEVSTEKPTQVGATAKLAATISGKVYRFRPNEINVKSLSLILTGPQQRYDMETYARDATKSGLRFTGAIGLEGLYRKGERIDYGFDGRIGGFPRVNAVKGTWQDDHTFVIDRLVLGLAQSPEKWTLTFDGDKLNVRIKFGGQPEISIDGETGE